MYRSRSERIIATIEARMTSSRLPGKVLLPLAGIPALRMMIERVKRSKYLDDICVATTDNTADDPIVTLAQELGVRVFRGSESDVLGRVVGAAKDAAADIIVELTGDCPFMHADLVDRGIEEFFSHEVDYAANTITPTYANGFDVQVYPRKILEDVEKRTSDPVDRTHVTTYIVNHPERYRLFNWEAPAGERGPETRVTLDETDDYKALLAIADALYPDDPCFTPKSIMQYLKAHPEVSALNAHIRQKDPGEL